MIRRFLFELVGVISPDRKLLGSKFIIYVSPILFLLEYTVKLRKYYNFGTKNSRRAWHDVPAQEQKQIKGANFRNEFANDRSDSKPMHIKTICLRGRSGRR